MTLTDLSSLTADQLAEKVRDCWGTGRMEEAFSYLAELQTRANRIPNYERHVEREIEPKLLARAEAAEKERDEHKESWTMWRDLSDDYLARAQAAEKERDEALEAVSRLTADCEVCRGESAAEARLAETQKALRFYAAESTYEEASPVGSALEGTIPIREDRGSIARAALTTHPEEKP